MNGELYHVWLSIVCGAGSVSAPYLLRNYGSPEAVYVQKREDLVNSGLRLETGILDRLCDKNLDATNRTLEWCEKNGVRIVTCDNDEYPSRLRAIDNYPVVLYVYGELATIANTVTVAIVGTRKMSAYGESAAYCLARGLALGGAAVVSGMADGIDSCAHRGALDVSGYTAAVLGCGIDRVYPPSNEILMKHIALNGAVITEYAPHTPPNGQNFPVRNRIISGLCHGTVIVEAGEKSGAMITAMCARAQGRDIYAIPGEIDAPGSYGPNKLIKQNARIVTSAADILCGYEFLYPDRIQLQRIGDMNSDMRKYRAYLERKNGKNATAEPIQAPPKLNKNEPAPKTKEVKPPSDLNSDELRMYEYIRRRNGCLPEELTQEGFTIAQVMSCLTILELKDKIEPCPGGIYKAK